MSGIVHHDCPNSGNPYHECHDQCFKRISSGDVPKKEKKRFGKKLLILFAFQDDCTCYID
jgi:hypothetical protein